MFLWHQQYTSACNSSSTITLSPHCSDFVCSFTPKAWHCTNLISTLCFLVVWLYFILTGSSGNSATFPVETNLCLSFITKRVSLRTYSKHNNIFILFMNRKYTNARFGNIFKNMTLKRLACLILTTVFMFEYQSYKLRICSEGRGWHWWYCALLFIFIYMHTCICVLCVHI